MSATRFWDKIAVRYAKKPIADEAAYQHKLKITREYFSPRDRILEFGCGTGSTAISHAPFVADIQATDLSAKMIEIAKDRAAEAKVTNVTFTQTGIEDLEQPNASLDAVLGLSILHLLPNKEAAIAKVFRMLKPGGVFITSTVCLGDGMAWFRFVGPIGKALGVFPLVKVFTAQELIDSLTDAGFMIDYRWRPGKNKAVFIVAKKPSSAF